MAIVWCVYDLVELESCYPCSFQVLLSKDFQIVSTLGLLCDNDRTQLAQSLLKIFKHDKREATLLKTLTSVEVANEGMNTDMNIVRYVYYPYLIRNRMECCGGKCQASIIGDSGNVSS